MARQAGLCPRHEQLLTCPACDVSEAAEALKDISGIEGLPVMLGRRKVFPNAASTGRGITEYLPKNPKALAEFQQLLTHLYTGTISE